MDCNRTWSFKYEVSTYVQVLLSSKIFIQAVAIHTIEFDDKQFGQINNH